MELLRDFPVFDDELQVELLINQRY